jgi:hypothetical protein
MKIATKIARDIEQVETKIQLIKINKKSSQWELFLLKI